MFDAFESLKARVSALRSEADFWSLRHVKSQTVNLGVTKSTPLPLQTVFDEGVMLTAQVGGFEAYAATSDLSSEGLQRTLAQAERLANAAATHALSFPAQIRSRDGEQADYISLAHDEAFPPVNQCLEMLLEECNAVPSDARIVNREACLSWENREQLFFDSVGSQLRFAQRFVYPDMRITAYDGHDSQIRSLSGGHFGQQGGISVLGNSGFFGSGPRLADEALQLLMAPNAPSGRRHLLLMPDQMILQIHESIGHPLEMDRILGDERNYAGTSFVKLEDFGHYRYGSPLLNVSFDPRVPEELASYSHDDEGTPAETALLIEGGILKRPLGSSLSTRRSGVEGVANSRACSWNRPAIDRMANLNVEPGDQGLEQLIAGIQDGILMAANRSWSIDDARNKFQFGCEWGQLIENGELRGVVKNPNYRGISSQFWRNLVAVGNRSTRQVLGTANCGKGEPNQAVRVGHASPACVFADIDIFGGAQ
ncbi:TldD/PmbA family protein [Stutzerimonas stutzeri]|uniref:TldD/PmbA family protein n=1 Tax=Stutzerimonas stutzeri TaxID=316 RepID=UPI00210EAE80|nr:TldD/PmbA family protein [Stutzerimonas stutzeri]MCQ4319742.1 TldD/PmbA family protein [Stutzerimonas stutzeri]